MHYGRFRGIGIHGYMKKRRKTGKELAKFVVYYLNESTDGMRGKEIESCAKVEHT